jgi:hypothetical protein
MHQSSSLAPIPENRLIDELAEAICTGMRTCCVARAHPFDEAACGASVRDYYDALGLPTSSDVIRYDALYAFTGVRRDQSLVGDRNCSMFS